MQTTSEIETELEKLETCLRYGAGTVMDLSSGGDIPRIRGAIIGASRVPIGTVPIYEAIMRVSSPEEPPARTFWDEILPRLRGESCVVRNQYRV